MWKKFDGDADSSYRLPKFLMEAGLSPLQFRRIIDCWCLICHISKTQMFPKCLLAAVLLFQVAQPAHAQSTLNPESLAKQLSSADAPADAVPGDQKVSDYWIEPGTGLMWTVRDNGADLTWKDAVSYCQKLSLGGYRDWWLPATNDLARIYDASEKEHVKGGIQLSMPWVWSVSQPENEHASRDSFWHGASYGIYRPTLRGEFLFFGDGTQNSDKAESDRKSTRLNSSH